LAEAPWRAWLDWFVADHHRALVEAPWRAWLDWFVADHQAAVAVSLWPSRPMHVCLGLVRQTQRRTGQVLLVGSLVQPRLAVTVASENPHEVAGNFPVAVAVQKLEPNLQGEEFHFAEERIQVCPGTKLVESAAGEVLLESTMAPRMAQHWLLLRPKLDIGQTLKLT
jgi:hypothetical protein